MYFIIITLFYFTISTILPSRFLFKRKKENIEVDKIKILINYFLIMVMHTILLLISFYISTYKYKILGYCGLMCQKYTTNSIFILLALIINLVSNILFYIFTKKILVKILNTKLKYLILIVYILFGYCALLFGLLTFYGFMGIYVIKNPILYVLRIIITLLPLVIYPIDIIVIDKLKARK